MKVLSIEKYHFITGGASRLFFDMNDLLTRRGHQVFPFTGSYPQNLPSPYSHFFVPRALRFAGEPAARTGPAAWAKIYADALYALDVRRAVGRLVRELEPDIAHLHTFLYQLSPSLIGVLKSQGIPIVHTVHDFNAVCASRALFVNGGVCEKCKVHRYHQILFRNCYNADFRASFMAFSAMIFHRLFRLYPNPIDKFLAPSRFVMEKLAEWGFPKEKLIYLPHFVPAERYPEPDGNPGQGIVFFGYLVRQKGIRTLLDAMSRLRHIDLTIFGRGPERKNIEQQIETMGLRNVRLGGFLSGEPLFKAVRRARLAVFPSECYETFGMGILESFMVGRPVVASDLGAYPEIVIPGRTGVLFPPGDAVSLADAIDRLYDSPELAACMGKEARETVIERFNPEVHYRKLMDIYRAVLGLNTGA